jgi:hypothetical protein
MRGEGGSRTVPPTLRTNRELAWARVQRKSEAESSAAKQSFVERRGSRVEFMATLFCTRHESSWQKLQL